MGIGRVRGSRLEIETGDRGTGQKNMIRNGTHGVVMRGAERSDSREHCDGLYA